MTTEKEIRGKRIRDIRNRLGLSQEQLGKKLGGITKGSISGYESGDVNPTPEVLIEIAKIGGVTLDWLFTGKKSDDVTDARDQIAADDILGALQSLPLRQRYETIGKVVCADSHLPKKQVERKIFELLGPPWPCNEIEKHGPPTTEARARFIWLAACEETGLSEPVFSDDYSEKLQMFQRGEIDDLELFLVAKEWLGRIFGAQEKK